MVPAPGESTAEAVKLHLRALSEPDRVEVMQRFFKTGPGQYGEGDVLIGVRVPNIRAVVKRHADLAPAEVSELLDSPVHEDRLAAVLILVRQFERGTPTEQEAIYRMYLARADRVNGWDLVDSSAPQIVGGWLTGRPEEERRATLDYLIGSRLVWNRRIGMLATLTWIRAGEFGEALRLSETVLGDDHDLIHKASGWMLREVGKRDERPLLNFLERNAYRMPRTMLRYALERLPRSERARFMAARGPGA